MRCMDVELALRQIGQMIPPKVPNKKGDLEVGALVWDTTLIPNGPFSPPFESGGHVITDKTEGGWMCQCRYAVDWGNIYVVGYIPETDAVSTMPKASWKIV